MSQKRLVKVSLVITEEDVRTLTHQGAWTEEKERMLQDKIRLSLLELVPFNQYVKLDTSGKLPVVSIEVGEVIP